MRFLLIFALLLTIYIIYKISNHYKNYYNSLKPRASFNSDPVVIGKKQQLAEVLDEVGLTKTKAQLEYELKEATQALEKAKKELENATNSTSK